MDLISQICWTLFGVLVLWLRHGTKPFHPEPLRRLLTAMNIPYGAVLAVEAVLFIAVGLVMAVQFTSPQTAPQAITAGFAWTKLLPSSMKGGKDE